MKSTNTSGAITSKVIHPTTTSSSSSSTTTMSSPQEETIIPAPNTMNDDLEPRKLNDETFDTEDNDDSSSLSFSDHNNRSQEEQSHQDEALKDPDATVDILDQLVELFIERNGREPNGEEVMQWIKVFQSLRLEEEEDNDVEENNDAAENNSVMAAE